MGLLNFINAARRAVTPTPAPAPATSTAPQAATSPAKPAAAPVNTADTFQAGNGQAAMCSLDGSGPNACFPEFATQGSGGGGKPGVIVE